MLNNEKLNNMEKVILANAEAERESALAELEALKSAELEQYEKQAEANLNERLYHETGKIESIANERVAEKTLECKKSFFCEREKKIKALFDAVADKLTEYTSSDEYVAAMKKKIEAACSNDEHSYVIVVSSYDKKLIDFAKNNGYNTEIIEKNLIGGCRVVDKTNNTLVDLTFANALKYESDTFLDKYFKLN